MFVLLTKILISTSTLASTTINAVGGGGRGYKIIAGVCV